MYEAISNYVADILNKLGLTLTTQKTELCEDNTFSIKLADTTGKLFELKLTPDADGTYTSDGNVNEIKAEAEAKPKATESKSDEAMAKLNEMCSSMAESLKTLTLTSKKSSESEGKKSSESKGKTGERTVLDWLNIAN
jgi:hypothetical protein